MTSPQTIARTSARFPWPHRLVAGVLTLVAGRLAALPPARLRAVLRVVRRGARPADHATALRCRTLVTSVSLKAAGPQGCLRRSVATVLVARLAGQWPEWCAGVRVSPPFAAHAWVRAEGRDVGEPHPEGYYRAMVSVPAVR
ncbi:lasso peptide biosynthesis B2 protein [Amycolatopsis sp. NPDC049688]|uniref:lasso peptide biosynthesis B2 protein n=1 Tax=Amycolatopsis sp. NPDC049688 TaxID=3154733 RepID=UPI0034263A46